MEQSRPWRRVLVEALVILASVLTAFAVDAWWDRGQARTLEAEIRASVIAEFRADSAALEVAIARNQASLATTTAFLISGAEELRPLKLDDGQDMSLAILGFWTFSSAAVAAYLLMETPPADASSLPARSAVGEALRAMDDLVDEHRKSELLQNEIRAHLARYRAGNLSRQGLGPGFPVEHDGVTLAQMRVDQALLASLISKRGLQLSYVTNLRATLERVSEAIRFLEQ
jgi:hypothetical protein